MDSFKKVTFTMFALAVEMAYPYSANAQISASDSVMSHATKHKLSIGGYGEAVYSRDFFSDNVYRYAKAADYKNTPSHGRFDIPHAVIYMSYDFGKGWTMGSEIEFEHGGTGTSYEKDYDEAGEWEQEVEKGGEVELEQFWLQKSFSNAFNIKAGHIVVPIGQTNAHHEPLNFFTVYRPEGENTIFPCTWHQTGISFWGRIMDWRYELLLLPGIDAMNFTREGWIHNGANSAFEFAVANRYAVAARIDNYSIQGLRIGISAYYGQSFDNTYNRDANSDITKKRGAVTIGTFDFTYNAHNWIVRGNFDYGHLNDAAFVSSLPGRATRISPYSQDLVGKAAMATGIEAGWDLFSQIKKMHEDEQKLYLFGHYEYYDYYIPANNLVTDYPESNINRIAIGFNYYPVPQIAIKGEYSHRFLKSQYNDEPSISLGIAYEGFFL